MRWKKIWRIMIVTMALVFVAACLVVAGLWFSSINPVGGVPQGNRLARMRQSPQWKHGEFHNSLKRVDGSITKMFTRFLFGGSKYRQPNESVPVIKRSAKDFELPPNSGLRITWLGHSTMIVEIDGLRLLIDPVWGERASPFSWMGPQRFYEPPLALSEIPEVDAILISHDHYDHLDYSTVVHLSQRRTRWLVPLGVGAHLEGWGVPARRITELDWWQSKKIGLVKITCTPARHFSGRSIFLANQNVTLWSGWAVVGPEHRVFYSGDTALHPTFEEIGARLGPFDVGIFEVGAYNALWSDVHLGPEQAVMAHQMIKGRIFVPVHWGLFDLALHGWTEPIERTVVAAERAKIPLVTAQPGASFELGRSVSELERKRWWPSLPWQNERQAPCYSSGVENLVEKYSSRHRGASQ